MAKRSRRTVAIAVGVVAVLAVGGVIVGESVARGYATNLIREKLAAAFHLDAAHPMDITIGGGSLLVQALRGSVESVHVVIDDVPLGELAGTVTLDATAVPLDTSKPLGTLRASVAVNESNVQKLRTYLSGIPIDSIGLGDGVVTATSTVKVLGFSLPVAASVTPTALDGQLHFELASVQVSGATLSLDELRSGRFASLADSLLPTQSFCVAQYLPSSIVLTKASATPKALVLHFAGDGAILDSKAMSTRGACP